MLSLLLQLFLDSTRLSSAMRWLARIAAPIAAVAISGGFFGLAVSSTFRWLIYLGALAMVVALVISCLRPVAKPFHFRNDLRKLSHVDTGLSSLRALNRYRFSSPQ